MNETISREYLLLEFLFLSRRQQEQFTTIINTYSTTMSSLNSNIRMLLQRYMDNDSNYINNLMGYRQLATAPNISNIIPPQTSASRTFSQRPRQRRNSFIWNPVGVQTQTQTQTQAIPPIRTSLTGNQRRYSTNFSFANTLNNT